MIKGISSEMTSKARWPWQWDRDLFSDEEIAQRQGQFFLLCLACVVIGGGALFLAFNYG